MNTADYSGKAAVIVDDIIGRSDGDLGPEDRDPFRVIVRIAFEVQELLATKSSDVDALDWTQDTVLSGCDSIHLARSAWSLLRLAGALDEDGKSRPSKTDVQPSISGSSMVHRERRRRRASRNHPRLTFIKAVLHP